LNASTVENVGFRCALADADAQNRVGETDAGLGTHDAVGAELVHGAVDGDDDVGTLPFGDRFHEGRGRTPVDLQAIGRCGLEGWFQPAIDGHLEGEAAHDGDGRRRCHGTSLLAQRTPPL
jgi:hypothetical protein